MRGADERRTRESQGTNPECIIGCMNRNTSGDPLQKSNDQLMRNNFIRFIALLFTFTKIQGVKRFSLMLAALFALSACYWTTGVFEKNQDFKDHDWPASVTPD